MSPQAYTLADGHLLQLCSQAIAVAAAKRNVSAVVIVCFSKSRHERLTSAAIKVPCIVLDVGLQMGQVSNSTRIYALDANARARLNSIFIISLFLGQMMGSSAGSSLYDHYGWTASSSLSLGFLGLAILILLSRGPHAQRWIGWDGGARMRKLMPEDREKAARDPAEAKIEKTGEEDLDNESSTGTLQELDKDIAPKVHNPNSIPLKDVSELR